jgi:hypothetical protein
MALPIDLQALEEAMVHIAKARHKVALLGCRPDDLDSLLSVAESKAKRVYADLLSAQTAPATIPVILSEPPAKRPQRPRRQI